MAYDQEQADYFTNQGLVLNPEGTEWVKPASTLPVDAIPDAGYQPDIAARAAYQTSRSVTGKEKLPVADDRGHPFGPINPEAPSYLVEPDLQEAQQGMTLPQNMYQDAGGGIFFNGGQEPVPVAKRPGLLPVTMTPEGLKFVMPRMMDIASNVMGNVGGPLKVPAKAGEMVLGSGMVRKALDNLGNPLTDYHGNPIKLNENGKLELYHRTNDMANKDEIYRTGKFKSKENTDETFFADNPESEYGKGFGDHLVKIEIDPKYVRMNDQFPSGENHYAIPNKYLNKSVLRSDTHNQVSGQIGHQVEKNGFYSTLQTAVANAKPSTATAEQWLGYLRNQPGVKAEEINTVLKDLPSGQISKGQLEDIVKQNKVEVKEKVLQDNEHFQLHYKDTLPRRLSVFGPVLDEIKDVSDIALAKRHNSSFRETVKNVGDLKAFEAVQEAKKLPKFDNELKQFDTRQEAEQHVRNLKGEDHIEIAYKRNDKETKYASYQLPGGENYKEMLLKLPEKMVPNGRFVVTDGTPTFNMAANTRSEAQDIINNMQKHSNKSLSIVEDKMPDTHNNFQSSHWDEPNVLAHIRMNDRYLKETGYNVENQASKNARMFGSQKEAEDFVKTLPEDLRNKVKVKIVDNGFGRKVLHIEEIQSDLHQKGRDLGYKGEKEKLQPAFDAVEAKLMATNDEKMLGLPKVEDVLKEAVDKKIISREEANTYKRYTDIENGQPVPDLPFKNNWEELAIKRIIRHAAEHGYEGISWEHGNAQALRYPDELRKTVSNIAWHDKNGGKVDPNGRKVILVEHKDGGQTIFDIDKHGTITAGPKEAKGKKLSEVIGKSMSQQILDGAEGHIDAKDFVMGAEGMKAAYDVRIPNKFNEIGKKYGSKVEQREILPQEFKVEKVGSGYMLTHPNGGAGTKINGRDNYFKHKIEAENYAKVNNDSLPKKPIHYFPITPALREKATKEGFPLFSSGSPTLIPVDSPPEFEDKKVKLIPVSGNPFK